MSRKVGQIIARGERRWLVRVYLAGCGKTHQGLYSTILAEEFSSDAWRGG
jgi:hypothetical protein